MSRGQLKSCLPGLDATAATLCSPPVIFWIFLGLGWGAGLMSIACEGPNPPRKAGYICTYNATERPRPLQIVLDIHRYQVVFSQHASAMHGACSFAAQTIAAGWLLQWPLALP